MIDNFNENIAEVKNSNQAIQVKKFDNSLFGEIRTIIFNDKNEPWFVLNEICKILGYKNPRETKAKHLREKDCKEVRPEMGRCSELSFLWESEFDGKTKTLINENGLYRLIMRSKKPSAALFQDWVTDEVLPMIRKTGMYATENTLDKLMSGDVDTISALLEGYKKAALELKQANAKIEEDRPKVEFHDAVRNTDNTILLRDFVNILNIKGFGEKKLFKYLRDKKIIQSNKSSKNLPYKEFIDAGYFEVSETVVDRGERSFTVRTPRITGKGQTWLTKKILNDPDVLEY